MASVSIHFFTDGIEFILKEKQKIRKWLLEVAAAEHYSITDLNYIFCSDAILLTINQDFLRHDTYTDIITFDHTEEKGKITGEIYISVDRVNENSTQYQTSPDLELRRVIVHGLLHLCGYKDKTKLDKELMTTKEDFYLALWQGKG